MTTTWNAHAKIEFPRAAKDLGLPAARPRTDDMAECELHKQPIGEFSRMCLQCLNEAWDEVVRRYERRRQMTSDSQ